MEPKRNEVARLSGWAGKLMLGCMVALGCAHSPDELSVTEHRSEALSHQEKAFREEAQYDPKAGPDTPRPPVTQYQYPLYNPNYDSQLQPNGEFWVYNPTEHHLITAAAEREHALEHARAAAELEQTEARECNGIAPEARAACPLLSPYVSKIIETADGVRLQLKPDAPGDSLVRQMRCQLAYARARAFKDVHLCALYSRGAEVQLLENGSVIGLRGEGPAAAAEIRKRIRQQVAPGKASEPHARR